MANTTLKHLIDMAVTELQDSGYDGWSEQSLVDAANLGARQIVTFVPAANTVIDSVKLAASSRQTIGVAGVAFIRAIRNMGTDGKTPGRAIDTLSDIKMLNAFDPDWPTATADDEIKEAAKDLISPLIFWVYPPADGTSYIEIERSEVPTMIVWDDAGAWETATVGVSNEYVGPLLDFILYRAYSQDSDYPGNEQRAATHMAAFRAGLGITINAKQQQ